MLKKLLSFFGYTRRTYTIKAMGLPPIAGVTSWRRRGGAVIANTPNGKTIIFTAQLIEITGGGIRREITAEDLQDGKITDGG